MKSDEDKMFADLQSEMVGDVANSLLDRQIGSARTWMAQRQGRGEPNTLYDLIMHCAKEPNTRAHVITAYCAALVRLIEIEDERARR